MMSGLTCCPLLTEPGSALHPLPQTNPTTLQEIEKRLMVLDQLQPASPLIPGPGQQQQGQDRKSVV